MLSRNLTTGAFLASALLARAASANCTDGIRNGPESGIDCGGDCAPCERGRPCRGPRDCYSGRCAGSYCEEREYEPGTPVPPGYDVQMSEADGAAASRTLGWVSLGLGYGAAYVAALSQPGSLSVMYVPVVGPWVKVTDEEQSLRGLIAIDGLLQTVGAALLIGGYAAHGQQLVRIGVEARSLPASRRFAAPSPERDRGRFFTVAPLVTAHGGSLSIIGVF